MFRSVSTIWNLPTCRFLAVNYLINLSIMSVFSIIPLPEEIGQDTLLQTRLKGSVFDIHGNPLSVDIGVALNKRVTRYKTKTNVAGEEQMIQSDENDGSWFFDAAESFGMTSDSYYRITINEMVFRKNLPDFPPEISLNQLKNY